MSQTSYAQYHGAPFAGLLADGHPNVVESFVIDKDSANIAPGVFVAQGTSEQEAIGLAAAEDAASIIGIVLHRHVDPFNKTLVDANNEQFVPYERIDVVTKGRVWVPCETAIAKTDALFIRCVAHGAGKTVIGALTKTSDTTYTAAAPAGIRVISAASAAGVVLVEFDAAIKAAMDAEIVRADAAYAAHA